jgi:predicted outer membrane repeat protein
VRFTGNQASSEGGAAYINNHAATVSTFLSSVFDGNKASSDGGAITWYLGPLALLGDSFVLNGSPDGGALYADTTLANGGLLTMEDTTMSRNTATTEGGAIDAETTMGLTLINDTIAFNNAPASQGGGIYQPNEFVAGGSQSTGFGVENTSIAENSGGDCSTTFNKTPPPTTSTIDQGNNNDSDQTCFGGIGGPNDKVGVNPLLANPANNGGPAAGGPGDTETVQTDAEQASSPTVDAGNNNGCPSVDERGVKRPQGAACDIGAFEFGANPPPATTATTTAPPPITTTSTTTRTTTTTTTHHRHHRKHHKCKKHHHRKHGKCVKNKKHHRKH